MGNATNFRANLAKAVLRFAGNRLEVGHNEIGDAGAFDRVVMPKVLEELFGSLGIPCPSPVPAMRFEFYIAQNCKETVSLKMKK